MYSDVRGYEGCDRSGDQVEAPRQIATEQIPDHNMVSDCQHNECKQDIRKQPLRREENSGAGQ